MAQVFKLPRLGDSVADATILEWNVQVGDKVEKDQIVCLVETTKTTVDIPCPYAGYVIHLGGKVGDVINLDETVLVVGEQGETWSGGETAAPAAKVEDKGPGTAQAEAPAAADSRKIKATPKVRKLARDLGVDLAAVEGTGPRGRITAGDVKAAATAPAAPAPAAAPAVVLPTTGPAVREVLPLSGMRKAMADAMHGVMSTTAQMSVASEVDMTNMLALRQRMVERADELGAKVSITDLLIAVAARAVKASPLANAAIVNDEIHVYEDVNVGIAMSLATSNMDSSLVVPVIRNADRKSAVEINQEVRELAQKGMSGKLSPDDLSGGTITFASTSALYKRWMVHTPIMPPNTSCLLGANAIVKRPTVVDDEIVIRPIMPYVITYDHRIMDGRLPGLYMNAFCELIEHPDSLWYF